MVDRWDPHQDRGRRFLHDSARTRRRGGRRQAFRGDRVLQRGLLRQAEPAVNRVTVAAVQAAPVYLDRAATVARVLELTAEAAGLGAKVIVFPEAFVPTYPDWIWRISPADGALQDAYFERWLAKTMMVPGPETENIDKPAKKACAFLVVGVNERVLRRGTVYNSILFFGPDGALLSRRRKLMPTSSER